MARILLTTITLYVLWLALSGHYTPLLLGLGLVSAFGTSLIAYRMGILDDEGLPLGILVRLPFAAVWLITEILKSNLDVIKIILDPSSATPTRVVVNATQKTGAGIVTHANFITLTPGTVSLAVNDRRKTITVHGLTRELAEGCLDGGMDRRVSELEGRREA